MDIEILLKSAMTGISTPETGATRPVVWKYLPCVATGRSTQEKDATTAIMILGTVVARSVS
jgi:hypothetical protein